jgi:TonB family protein
MIRPFRAAAVVALLLTTSAAPPPEPGPALTPPGKLAELFSDEDYPQAALRMHEQGKVDFRLDIDSAGAVARCTVTHSSGSASLDETTCRLLQQRARFRPARDSDGNAVPDTFEGHIVWRIDDSTAAPSEFEAATQIWVHCLAEAVRQRIVGPDPAETIVAKAFDACTAEEAPLTAIGVKTESSPPAAGSGSMRQGMRSALLQWIAAAKSNR